MIHMVFGPYGYATKGMITTGPGFIYHIYIYGYIENIYIGGGPPPDPKPLARIMALDFWFSRK